VFNHQFLEEFITSQLFAEQVADNINMFNPAHVAPPTSPAVETTPTNHKRELHGFIVDNGHAIATPSLSDWLEVGSCFQ